MKSKVNPPPAPTGVRYVLITARVPIPLDQWEASSIVHNMKPAIAEVQKILAEASGDPNMKMTQEIITPRPEGSRKPGRKPQGPTTAADEDGDKELDAAAE